MTKNQSFKFDTKPSNQIGKGAFSQNLFCRNKPNFNHPNITPTPYDRVTYSDLQPNPKNGTNPNKPNFRQVASKPWRRRMPIPNTLNPHSFQENPVFLKILFLGFKPNFPTQRNTANSCSGGTYNNLLPELRQKNKPKTNPNKPNFPAALLSTFYRPTLSGQRPAAQFRLTSGAISVTVIPLSNSIRKEYNLILRSPCYV